MKSPIKLAFAAAALFGASFVALQPASAMPIAPTAGAETSPLVQNVWHRHWGGHHYRPYYRPWGYYHRPHYWGGYYHRPYHHHWRHW